MGQFDCEVLVRPITPILPIIPMSFAPHPPNDFFNFSMKRWYIG
jgi:hypothetical protein